ncbi:uncharacterized protein OCT59_009717 [Rhizophagus irregularis]|uniref:Uncharacterized protein n=1 Tax=Rhizophagus irregularis TaxID=588596 RepID=A0A915ZKX4_9GLOM|nr:hypothetical protein OCT59_009717 [Rhizophagus irregularis]GET53728.1 hypothetical protein RIR_jg13091.t1 [Rhizophagus irregularis DAOM 181602=DAOM 197198]CAB5381515.1 unnamed protein product [Rhizophagus irregularis]
MAQKKPALFKAISVVLRKINERSQEFKNWGEVAEILSLETDNKVLYEETGNEQICTKLLVNGLKDFDLTISDLDQLLLMYDESISEFHNKKTTLKNLPYAQSRVGPDNLSKPKNVTTKKTSLKVGCIGWYPPVPIQLLRPRLHDYTTFWTTFAFNTGNFY